jgi:hypothetical protein
MMGRARIGVTRLVDFRTRWANKSDRAINAVLSHFWSRLNPDATTLKKQSKVPTIKKRV